MAYVDEMKNSTHDDIQELATKHGAWESFYQDVQRLAETAWHNARAQGHDPSSVDSGEKTVEQLQNDVTYFEQQLADAQDRLEQAQQAEPQGDDVDGANASGDGGNEPAPAATLTPGPTDDGEQVTKPAEPASPVSEGGFPTSNVDVAQPAGDPVLVQPVEPAQESHPA
jgi:hypothetical protein